MSGVSAAILAKYVGGGEDKKKKKKKKITPGAKPKKTGGLRIVDEDGFLGLGNDKGDNSDEDETVEELPQIAGVVDERPREMQLEEEWRKGKWKTLEGAGDKDDQGSESRERRRHDSDESPPRIRRRRHDSSDEGSPPRKGNKGRHDSDSDLSPPRKQRHDSDESPPRRKQTRRDSNSDLSPPRPGRRRNDSGSDLSPPRRDRRSSPPPRKGKSGGRRRGSDSDLSPPRPGRSNRNDDDLSPPRHSKRDRDLSPPRRRGGRDRENGVSKRAVAVPEIIQDDRPSFSGTTLEGKKAGLQRASDLRKEMVDYRKKENEMFQNLDDDISGRTAVTKVRDRKTGRERDFAQELAKKEEEEKIAAEKKKQYDKWGAGLKQVEEREQRVQEALHEIAKPLARYADDRDLDEFLKHQERDGDPMLKFLSKKKAASKKGSDKPAYEGPPPAPNRFGIPPGCRWDGVDRSIGYEKEWFSRINARRAMQDEAYKWSTEDL